MTGVQTCALPILVGRRQTSALRTSARPHPDRMRTEGYASFGVSPSCFIWLNVIWRQPAPPPAPHDGIRFGLLGRRAGKTREHLRRENAISFPAPRSGEGGPHEVRWKGRAAMRLVSPPTPPPPCFAWSPSPASLRYAVADKRHRSRDADASEFCWYDAQEART